MPLYDYRCPTCGTEEELACPIAERKLQACQKCGTRLEQIFKPAVGTYVPFSNYFDEGLGVEVTGRDHRRRVMRDLKCDHREPPKKGDLSARADRCHEQRKERARA